MGGSRAPKAGALPGCATPRRVEILPLTPRGDVALGSGGRLADGPAVGRRREVADDAPDAEIPPVARGRERKDSTARRLLEVDRIPMQMLEGSSRSEVPSRLVQ